MEIKELKQFRKEIKEIDLLNKEEYRIMRRYYIESYFYSMLTFGRHDSITLECKDIWNKFINILKEEKSIHRILIDNFENININSAYELLDMLDVVNDESIVYFIDAYEDIIDSCEMKAKWRAQHRKKKFSTILETDEYKKYAYALTINFNDIKEFLNYPDEFWNYIKDKTVKLDYFSGYDESFNSVLMHFDEDNNLDNIRVYVPKIVNLYTALINIHEFKHAYDLYQLLGCKIDNEEEFEKRAREKEDEFFKTYVNKLNK